jgi:hypothetical protein
MWELNGNRFVGRQSIEAREESPKPIEEKTTMSHSARYERGLAKFVEMYGERTRTFLASLEGIAPDLGTYVMEFAFGDIHCRRAERGMFRTGSGGGDHADGVVCRFSIGDQRNSSRAGSLPRTIETEMIAVRGDW